MPLSFPEDFPFTLAPVIFTFCIDSERGIPPETQGRRVQGRLPEVGRRKPCPWWLIASAGSSCPRLVFTIDSVRGRGCGASGKCRSAAAGSVGGRTGVVGGVAGGAGTAGLGRS